MHSMENRPRVKGPLRRGLTPPPLTRKTFGEPALWHLTRSIHISGIISGTKAVDDTSRNARRWTALVQGQHKINLMSVAELAQLLNVSRGYVVRELLCKHVLRSVIVVGGRRYVLRSKAEA